MLLLYHNLCSCLELRNLKFFPKLYSDWIFLFFLYMLSLLNHTELLAAKKSCGSTFPKLFCIVQMKYLVTADGTISPWFAYNSS